MKNNAKQSSTANNTTPATMASTLEQWQQVCAKYNFAHHSAPHEWQFNKQETVIGIFWDLMNVKAKFAQVPASIAVPKIYQYAAQWGTVKCFKGYSSTKFQHESQEWRQEMVLAGLTLINVPEDERMFNNNLFCYRTQGTY